MGVPCYTECGFFFLFYFLFSSYFSVPFSFPFSFPILISSSCIPSDVLFCRLKTRGREDEKHMRRYRDFKISGLVDTKPAMTDKPQIHEAELLRALSSPADGLGSIPSPDGRLRISSTKLLHYDLPTHTQVLADFPSSLDLKSYLTAHGSSVPTAQANHLGRSLGIWLHAFHAWANPSSPSAAQTAARAAMRQNAAMGDLKHVVNFGRLGPAIALFPVELAGCAGLFADVEATMRAEMDGYGQGGGEPIHGDFWCGNILLADLPLPPPESAAETLGEGCVGDIVVIDWELAHFSTRAADVAQLLAELFLLSHFRGLRCAADVMAAFLEGYGWEGGEGGRDREMAFRVAVAMGTHLVVFAPQTRGWDEEWDARGVEGGDEKGAKMRECVTFGRDVICHSWGQGRDAGWFSGGVLERLFSSSSEAETQREDPAGRCAEIA